MIDLMNEYLGPEDDADLWRLVLDTVFSDLDDLAAGRRSGPLLVEVGRCSHWLRPHQTRWQTKTGDQFAWPSGYGSGGGGFSRMGLPQFDWSVVLEGSGRDWHVATDKSARRALRVTVPSRTARHRKAAVHTLWATGREKRRRLYGFRKREGDRWRLTAATHRDVPGIKSPARAAQRCGPITTEAEWLACTDDLARWDLLRRQPVCIAKARLLAVAYCRRVWGHLTDARSRTAVEVADRYARGQATAEELGRAFKDAHQVPAYLLMRDEPLDEFLIHYPDLSTAEVAECCAANAAACVALADHPAVALLMFFAARDTAEAVYAAKGFSEAAWDGERVEQCRLIREVFGNPFQSAAREESRP